MGESNKVEFSATFSVTQVAEYLTRIAEGLLQGVITLSSEGKTIELTPGDVLRLEIEAESKPDKGKGSLAIDLSWKAKQTVPADGFEVIVGSREAVTSEPASASAAEG